MLAVLPSNTEPMIDEDKLAVLSWLSFFDSLSRGDSGTTWTPTFTGLTQTGTATITGKYWQLSSALVYFRILITPATDTSATAGSTYCDNFPLTFSSAGMSGSISGSSAALAGISASPKRIYTGTWTNITTPVTIVGIAEAS